MKSVAAHLLVRVYGFVFKLGIGRLPGFRRFFLFLYELYKRKIEDSLHVLATQRPQFFKGGHLLDVGANVGYTASILLRERESDFCVFAFEPEPQSFATLKSRFQNQEGIQLLPVAVGSTDGVTRLRINELHPADHRVAFESPDKDGSVEVRIVTLDSWWRETKRGPIAFLKIDVQGFEFDVLKGAEKLIQENPKLVIYFEFDPQMLKAYQQSPAELLNWLRARGFSFFEVVRTGDLKELSDSDLKTWSESNQYIDILACRSQESVAPG